jgi:hypothetical protein
VRKKISHPGVVIGCCLCLNLTGKRTPATTIMAGARRWRFKANG